MESILNKIRTYLDHRDEYTREERKIIRTQLRNELRNPDNEQFSK